MSCDFPLQGYRSRERGPSGKRQIVFNPVDGFKDLPVTIPCGQCQGCRLERSRQWAIRCMHEASLYDENCFLTLTEDDAHLPANGSLDVRTFQLFMKRLRKRFDGKTIRYYHCGEYGDKYGRPHYHCLLFGFDFPDKAYWTTRNGFPIFRSSILEEIWGRGHCEIGSVTFESAAYVAGYIQKKIMGTSEQAEELRYQKYGYVDREGEVFMLQPEYSTMSRRPGIGKPWLAKFGCEVYPEDGVVVRGRLMKPPKYYDNCFEITEPELMHRVKAKRKAQVEEMTPKQLEDRAKVRAARLKINQLRKFL